MSHYRLSTVLTMTECALCYAQDNKECVKMSGQSPKLKAPLNIRGTCHCRLATDGHLDNLNHFAHRPWPSSAAM